MAVVGAAQILVRPSFAGFQTAARKQMPGFGAAAGTAYAGGFSKKAEAATRETFGSKAARGLKTAAATTGAVVGGILGFALQRGFSRLNAIEQAQAKLRGLGHDAKSIQGIMTSALASVKGTAFGLDEAATAAASAVAAGIKPGKELTRYLKLTADAATIAGTSFKDMGTIINQVTTAGRAQTDDLNQLADRGIPIYQWLAKQYKVNTIELRKMVSAGKVDAATFRKVIEDNIGGAALESGATTQGAFKNMQASLGRVGANLLSGLFPQLRLGFVNITKALGPVEDQAKVVGAALGGFLAAGAQRAAKFIPVVTRVLTGLVGVMEILFKGDYSGKTMKAFGWAEDDRIIDRLFRVRESVQGVVAILKLLITGDYSGKVLKRAFGWTEDSAPVDRLFTIREAIVEFVQTARSGLPGVGRAFRDLWASLQSREAGSLGDSFSKIGQAIREVMPQVQRLTVSLPSLPDLVARFADVAAFAAKHTTLLKVAIVGLASAFAVYKVAQAANTVIGRNSVIGFAAQIAATLSLAASNYALAKSHVAVNRSQGVQAVTTSRLTVATVAQNVAARAAGVASKVWAAGQWLLNAAMTANPIGIVVVAIAALVAGLIFAYKHSETFRNIVQGAWAGIKVAAEATWAFLRDKVWPGLVAVFQAVGRAAVWLWEKAIRPSVDFIVGAWNRVAAVVSAVWKGFLSPIFQLIGAIVVWLAQKIFAANVALIRGIWTGLGNLIRSVYDKIIKPTIDWFGRKISDFRTAWAIIMTALQNTWSAFAAANRRIYDTVIKPMISALQSALTYLRDRIWTPVMSTLKSAWSTLSSSLKTTYDKTLKPTIDAVGTVVGNLKTAFEKAVKAIGTAWDGLKEAARKPVRFVIDVINGLIGGTDGNSGGFNSLARKFGTDTISQIAYPKGLGFEGGHARGGITLDPRRPVIPGRSSYQQGDSLIASVRPGEGFTMSEALDPYERARLLALNKAALRGESAAQFRARWGGQFFLGGIAPVGGISHQHSGYPWARWAGDFPVGTGTPIHAFKEGVVAAVRSMTTSYGKHVRINHPGNQRTLYAHMLDFAVQPGQRVSAGQVIGRSDSTGNSTGPHVHFELSGGSNAISDVIDKARDVIGSVIDWAGQMKNRIAGPLGKLGEIASTPLGRMLSALPKRLATAAVDKAKGWLTNAVSSGDAGAAFGIGRDAARKAMLALGATSVGTYPGHQPSMNKAWDAMISNKAIGQRIADHVLANRKKYGISYVIWNRRIARDYAKGSIPAGAWAPYFDGNSSDPNRAHTNHVHTSYYADGTYDARRGWAIVGERQPELVNFRGGEQVAASRQQAREIFGGPSGPQQIRGTLDLGNGLVGYVTGIIGDVIDARDTASAHRANIPGV